MNGRLTRPSTAGPRIGSSTSTPFVGPGSRPGSAGRLGPSSRPGSAGRLGPGSRPGSAGRATSRQAPSPCTASRVEDVGDHEETEEATFERLILEQLGLMRQIAAVRRSWYNSGVRERKNNLHKRIAPLQAIVSEQWRQSSSLAAASSEKERWLSTMSEGHAAEMTTHRLRQVSPRQACRHGRSPRRGCRHRRPTALVMPLQNGSPPDDTPRDTHARPARSLVHLAGELASAPRHVLRSTLLPANAPARWTRRRC